MARANVAANLAKWKRNASAAVDDYKTGVASVTTAPTHQAAAAVDKYARGVQDAVSSGRFVNNLMAVSLSDWQTAATQKGSRNYANGIANLSPKAQKAMADQQVAAAQISAEIQSMPNDSEADANARMLRNVELMRQLKKK
jgi:Zn-dependent M32 family carboxypeptidase